MDSTGLNLAVNEYRRSHADGFSFTLAGARGDVLRVKLWPRPALPLAPHVGVPAAGLAERRVTDSGVAGAVLVPDKHRGVRSPLCAEHCLTGYQSR